MANRMTDGPMDQWTDTSCYRDARTHVKRVMNWRKFDTFMASKDHGTNGVMVQCWRKFDAMQGVQSTNGALSQCYTSGLSMMNCVCSVPLVMSGLTWMSPPHFTIQWCTKMRFDSICQKGNRLLGAFWYSYKRCSIIRFFSNILSSHSL